MENKQTAVEYLLEVIKLFDEGVYETLVVTKHNEKAKELEKEQIINAFIGNDSDTDENLEVAEQYYNETYGRNK